MNAGRTQSQGMTSRQDAKTQRSSGNHKSRTGDSCPPFASPRLCVRPYSIFYLLTSILCFSPSLHAGLTWERTVHESKAAITDKQADIAFPFKNTGEHPVTIRRIHSSCGCTVARLDQKIYQPGEEGRVEAVFTFGHRKGRQEKTLIVETDSSETPREVLLLRVEIPDTIRVNKDRLTWEVGDPLEEQSFEITAAEETGQLEIKSLRPLGNGFDARVEEIEPVRTYQIAVRPRTTEHPQRSVVRVEVTDGRSNRTLNLQAMVQ